MRRLVAISGAAGAGKSTTADALAAEGWTVIAQADPIKDFCQTVFGFTHAQMFGPSEMRNADDPRYDTPAEWYAAWDRFRRCSLGWMLDIGAVIDGRRSEDILAIVSLGQWFESLAREPLSPRRAAQTLGVEWGRAQDVMLWTGAAIRAARRELDRGAPGVVVPDIRFRSELDAFRAAGALTVRVVRPGAGLAGEAGQHSSETEMAGIPDVAFDLVLKNDGTVEDIGRRMVAACYEMGTEAEHGSNRAER